MKTNELREKYLSFFESKGCVRRPSDVLVPRWDPSVLFTPAGMNQFKDHFLGRCKLDFTRATTCQKCLRTGDIDNVGRTAYHHTFFEMLGNFSFGDYFKRDAINWAWEFLTDKKWLGLPPERLSVTVYVDDDEAAEIWTKDIKLPSERILRIGEDENFWPVSAPSLGPDGVCGPCSEIYYHTDDGEVEIWNLVFTQFNRVGDPPDNLRPLPSKNIDTGMGLERTAAVLQGVETNYHIDILRPLVETAAEICGMSYDPESEEGRRLRRIVDHVRACSFAVHENVYPGPNKEKYVVKRLLRRAVLDGRQLGQQNPFLHKLVPAVANIMSEPYPELSETIERVAQVIEGEEANFLGTIDGGLNRIERIFKQMKSDNRGTVSGVDAAEMYQTYGFPPELFETMAAEHNFTFDWAGYQEEMEQHGIVSGAGQRGELFKSDPLESLKKAMHGSEFLGYKSDTVDNAKVVGIIAGDKLCDMTDEVNHEHPIVVVLDKTPLYGEMGGQVGDVGTIESDKFSFDVIDAQVDGSFTLHRGHLRSGTITLGDHVTVSINTARRQAIRRAHSATHLLHMALRTTLGGHAEQQGSKVDDDMLRFDFTNPKAVPRDVLAEIETKVNQAILAGEAIECRDMPLDEARGSGAMMLFGEKYPDVVRVVAMGDSKELCGGTHLKNTAQVGLFKIIGEESVAAGTRRITALTGLAALEHVNKNEAALSAVSLTLKIPHEEVPARVETMSKEIRKLKKQLAAGPASSGVSVDDLLKDAIDIDGVKLIMRDIPGAGPEVMRKLIDQLRRKASPVAVMLGSKQGEDKVMMIAGVCRSLLEKGVDAVAWIRESAKPIQGGGGGRPDLAQAGGKKPEGLADAFEKAKESIKKMLS